MGAEERLGEQQEHKELEEDKQRERKPAVEGLCHSAGPQLRAGFILGVCEHHLHLPPLDLRIYYTKLAAGSVHALSSYKVCSYDLLEEFTAFHFSFQVYLCSCGLWL